MPSVCNRDLILKTLYGVHPCYCTLYTNKKVAELEHLDGPGRGGGNSKEINFAIPLPPFLSEVFVAYWKLLGALKDF